MTQPEQPAVCGECRDMIRDRAWAFRALGHETCKTAYKAEQDAARKFWVRFNPAGCAEGSALYRYVGPLVDDAHKQFTPRIRDRRREAAEGYRHEVMTAAEWDERAKPCLLGQCEHRAAKTETAAVSAPTT